MIKEKRPFSFNVKGRLTQRTIMMIRYSNYDHVTTSLYVIKGSKPAIESSALHSMKLQFYMMG